MPVLKYPHKELSELRQKNGYTQQDLGDLLGLDNSSYGKIEKGITDISISKLELISNFYKMSLLELLAYPDTIIVDKKDNTKIESVKKMAKELLNEIEKL